MSTANDKINDAANRASENVRDLRDRAQSSAQTAAEAAGEKVDQARGKLNETADRVSDKAQEYGRKAQDYYGEARERADGFIDEAADRFDDAIERGKVYRREAMHYVDQNQGTALVIAVAAGFALGWLLKPSK